MGELMKWVPLPQYKPPLMSRQQLEQAVAVLPPQNMHNTGKIYLREPCILINERYEGVHIINNQNPESPQPVAFLCIPGNVDVAMKGNLLYADSSSDLLTFDVSNMPAARLLHRLQNAVSELPIPIASESVNKSQDRTAGFELRRARALGGKNKGEMVGVGAGLMGANSGPQGAHKLQ